MQKDFILLEKTENGEKHLLYEITDTPPIQYQEEMINANRELRVLPINQRVSEGKEYIGYKVTDYISLKDTLTRKSFNTDELLALLQGITQIILDAKRYLLSENGFTLQTKYIFIKEDALHQPYLLYLPIPVETTIQDKLLDLVDQLSDEVNYNFIGMGDMIMKLKRAVKSEVNLKKLNDVISAFEQQKPEQPPELAESTVTEIISAPPPAPVKEEPAPNTIRPVVFVDSQSISSISSIKVDDALAKPNLKPIHEVGGFKIPGGSQSTTISKPQENTKNDNKRGFFGFGKKSDKPKPRKKEIKGKAAIIDDRTMIDLQGEATQFVLQTAVLYVMDQGIKTEQIDINKTKFSLGRQQESVDYCFKNDMTISRIHATIIQNGGNYYLSDNQSTGGTFVNGQKLEQGQSAMLKNGDEIILYRKRLLFEIS